MREVFGFLLRKPSEILVDIVYIFTFAANVHLKNASALLGVKYQLGYNLFLPLIAHNGRKFPEVLSCRQ